MVELSREARCNPEALEDIGCGKDPHFAKLLEALCSRCETDPGKHGLPCFYGETIAGSNLMELVNPMLEEARDRTVKPACPHGFLAAILYLTGRVDLVPPDATQMTYRVAMPNGRVAMVMQCAFRQVARIHGFHGFECFLCSNFAEVWGAVGESHRPRDGGLLSRHLRALR